MAVGAAKGEGSSSFGIALAFTSFAETHDTDQGTSKSNELKGHLSKWLQG